MKKLIAIYVLFFVVIAGACGQSTSPRFATAKNGDNTGRVITYKYVSVTDVAGADTAAVAPSAGVTTVRVSALDSVAININSLKASYAADIIRIVASGASGNKVKFVGSNVITAGTATLSSGARAVITLIFDGAKWVEAGRVVQ
jgi:hypothetical protein